MSLARALQDENNARDAILRASAVQGIQVASFVAPIGYLIYSIRSPRTLLTASRFLRATWLGGVAGGALGTASGFYLVTKDPTSLREQRQELIYDIERIRAQDYSTIGSVLSTVLTSAFLWKRARLVHLVLGGAGLGAGAGYGYHLWRLTIEGSVKPGADVSSIHVPREKTPKAT